ncbi:MAG: S41 family peptidase [Acidobacteriota bacterium]
MIYVLRLLTLLFLLAAVGTGSTAFSQKKRISKLSPPPRASSYRPTAPASGADVQRRVDAFLKVWSTLNQNYFDPTFNNLNWNKIKTEFEPRVRMAKSDGELYALLNEMIGRLQRSHLAIITPEVYQAIERAKVEAKAREVEQANRSAVAGKADDTAEPELNFDDPLTQYGIGADLRIIDDRFVITRINQNSSAEYSGLKTGYVIEKINGVSLADLLRRIEIQNIDSARIKKYLPFEIVGSFLNGEKDSYVTVSYLDENDAHKEMRLRRERLKSQTVTLGQNFPDRQLQFEAASLSDDVGYIKFNIFAIPVIGKFCDAIGQFKTKKAIIIDLRGNMGGIIASMVALAGMMTDTSIDLGTSIYKTGSENLTASSKAKNFKGKVVFLVDNQTVSAAEIFAASMQDAQRAIVVGDKTAGEALPSVALDLPTGAVLLYPIANYQSQSGKYLEGSGVTPDLLVKLDRKTLLQGHDNQLDAALNAIASGNAPAVKQADPIEFSGQVFSAASPPPAKFTIKGDANRTVLEPAASGSGRPAPPPPPRPKPASNVKDAAALKILRDFAASIGGEAALKAIQSYALKGRTELLVKGTKNQFDLDVLFEKPGKYAEIMRSDAAGEIREVHSGTSHFVQTDYGLTRDLPPFANTGDLDILAPIRNVANMDFYRSLTFVGVFERDGRKVNLIDARTKDGYYLALAFDVETKELVSFTGSYYAMTFSDYRKAGDIKLPYRIERERVMNVALDEITLNAPIDEAKFLKKENCFDKEN